MAYEFKIESQTAKAIKVRHVAHGHRYIFAIREREGRRLLEPGPIFGNAKVPVSALTLVGAASTFAFREARKAGLID